MSRYRLTRRANRDLEAIWGFVADESSERRAGQVISDIREAARKIGTHPGIGHWREDLADESLRVWNVHSYLIVYRPEQRPIEIVRIVHGSRDIIRVFMGQH